MILDEAERIGESIGTGLSRQRHRSKNNIDKKSKPKDNMPDWWISARWVPSDSDSSDDDDNKKERDADFDIGNEGDNNDNNHDDDSGEASVAVIN